MLFSPEHAFSSSIDEPWGVVNELKKLYVSKDMLSLGTLMQNSQCTTPDDKNYPLMVNASLQVLARARPWVWEKKVDDLGNDVIYSVHYVDDLIGNTRMERRPRVQSCMWNFTPSIQYQCWYMENSSTPQYFTLRVRTTLTIANNLDINEGDHNGSLHG
ncbi:hypothetical protein GOBAR_AA06816 [Gossypium barbadense]|uniref:Uncharacterized protein n=1 Tax=Gossypium barbadense TaxID=3634 RepID=A0A2P5YDT0_GOSBA|nr:hypothetical protein GOBAR_AA06816 [Gossypium barbadense]